MKQQRWTKNKKSTNGLFKTYVPALNSLVSFLASESHALTISVALILIMVHNRRCMLPTDLRGLLDKFLPHVYSMLVCFKLWPSLYVYFQIFQLKLVFIQE